MNNAKVKLQDEIKLAQGIVAGRETIPQDFEVFKTLVGRLKGGQQFGLARKLLAVGHAQTEKLEPEVFARSFIKGRQLKEKTHDAVWLIQQQALCTYKDEELQPSKRFAEALRLLERIGLRNKNTTNAETLALGGAVYRRMWEQGGQLDDLYKALSFYQAAWDGDKEDAERCYGGVNAAFIYDQMAFRLRGLAATEITNDSRGARQSINATRAEDYSSRATKIRKEILIQLDEWKAKHGDELVDYWFAVTRADACFGLAMVDNSFFVQAKEWYSEAVNKLTGEEKGEKEWRLQTTFKQALSLARLHGYSPSEEENWKPVRAVLYALLGDATEQALTCQRGKVGLALSGGGFRASFYHLGVMARLAEMDVLRGVDVLSTVSGGSIVGAQYYLEVQHLLETHADNCLTPKLYIDAVKRLQAQFLSGVQRNIRMRTFANLYLNFCMVRGTYSRTHRLGELYEKELYRHVADNHLPSERRTMPQLLIIPANQPQGEKFHPKYNNWRRASKVPVLLLNSTSLNTGHNWQFTARSMGEPPGTLQDGVDTNERYRRLNYEQAPRDELQNFRLGYAVAASSCVPGLFEPIALKGLYPGRTVRLVDGGVHDNQGVAGLLDEGCTRILCSDASGQMQDEKSPADNFVGVPLRSFSISQDRVREAQLQDLQARTDSHALEGLFFVHLKKDLETEPIDWVDCQDPTIPPACPPCTTPYGIDRDLQRLLAGMRTDLDSFTDVEAYTLMLSGYLMTEYEFKQLQAQHERQGLSGTWGGYKIDAPREDWIFRQLENIIRKPGDSSDVRRQELEKQLKASSALFLKIWQLNKTLKTLALVGGIALILYSAYMLFINFNEPIFTSIGKITWGTAAIAVFTLAISIGIPFYQYLRPKVAMRNALQNIGVALAGWIVAIIHLCVFDKMFLRQGRLKRLLALPDK